MVSRRTCLVTIACLRWCDGLKGANLRGEVAGTGLAVVYADGTTIRLIRFDGPRLDLKFPAAPIAAGGLRRLLLIRLFQQTAIGSMNECLAQDFRRPCGSFSRSLLPKRPASGIWLPAAGRMALCVRNAEIGGLINWRTSDDGSVQAVGTKFL